jgi:hypothetical protein
VICLRGATVGDLGRMAQELESLAVC